MPSSGPAYFSTVVSQSAGNTPWSNPANAEGAADGSYATETLSLSSTDDLVFSHWSGSAIPSNATINGILVELYGHSNIPAGNAWLQTGPTQIGSTRFGVVAFTGSDSWVSIGGSSSNWGASLTPAIVNSSSFGFACQFVNSAGSVSVDTARMTIYYTLPGVGAVAEVRVFMPDDQPILEQC